MQLLHVGYENANVRRRYPFADNASLSATTGYELPLDAICDIVITSLYASIYVSEVTDTELVFTSDTGEEVGRAVFGVSLSAIYNDAGLEIGGVVFGPGWGRVAAAGPLQFTPTATPICAGCILLLPTAGVTAITDTAGIGVGGHVVVQGDAGVRSLCDDGALRIDFLGTAEPNDPCSNGPVIRKLCIEIWEGSSFGAVDSDGSGTISLTYNGKTLADVCADKNAGQLPDDDGNLPNSADYAGVAVAATPAAPVAKALATRTLLYSVEVDIEQVNGAVTLVSFPATGEPAPRLRIAASGTNGIELSLLGG